MCKKAKIKLLQSKLAKAAKNELERNQIICLFYEALIVFYTCTIAKNVDLDASGLFSTFRSHRSLENLMKLA